MSTASSPDAPPGRVGDAPALSRRRLVLVLGALMIGLFLSELDQTVFATALPTVVAELDGLDALFWVNTAYLLTGTLVVPVHGKLGDLLGRKPVFVAGLVVFLVGSLIGGLAQDMPTLLLARAVQGLGGGGLIVGVQAIVAEVFAPRERARVLSWVGAVFAGSSLLGPVLGGWLAEGPGWRWIFWINLPLGGLAVVAAVRFLDLPRPGRGVRVDVWGIATLSAAVSALVLLSAWAGTAYAWTSPVVLGLAAAVLVAGTAFVLVERRTPEPLIPLDLFARRRFTVPTVSALVLAVAMFGTIAYLPTYLQMASGLSPRVSGFVMLALIAGLGGATVIAGHVVARTGRQRGLAVTGGGLVAVALTGLALSPADTGLPAVMGWLLLLGLGIGAGLQLVVVMAQNAAPPAQLGAATSTVSFLREVGVVVGTAAVGAVFTARLNVRLPTNLPGGFDAAGIGPGQLRELPVDVQAQVATAYADALAPVLGWLVPLVVLSTVALALVRPVPLEPSRPSEAVRTGDDPAGRSTTADGAIPRMTP